jgi:MoxR-like ATPase
MTDVASILAWVKDSTKISGGIFKMSDSTLKKSIMPEPSYLHAALINNLRFLKLRFSEPTAHFLAVGLLTQTHLIMYGPAGCGKTTSARAAFLTALGLPYSDQDPEGNLLRQLDADSQMSTARLFGGAVAHTDPNTHITRQIINYEAGILSARQAIIDEAFDAPIDCLTALKGVMLRKVHNDYHSPLEMMALLSNKKPKALVEGALPEEQETIRALMERCLHFEVDLPNYSRQTFMEILKPMGDVPTSWITYPPDDLETERQLVSEVKIPTDIYMVLSFLSEDSSQKSHRISPRALSYLAIPVLKAVAYLKGRDVVKPEDLEFLSYAGVFAETTLANRFDEITKQRQIDDAKEAMRGPLTFISEIEAQNAMTPATGVIDEYKNRLRRIRDFQKALSPVIVPDTMFSELANLREALNNIQVSTEKAIVQHIAGED